MSNSAPLVPEPSPAEAVSRRGGWAMGRARLLARPWRLAALFACIVLPLWVAGEMADDVARREALRFDEPILLALHARSSPGLDLAARAVSEVGGFVGTAALGVFVAWRLHRAGRARAMLFWATSLGGAGALNVVAKLFFRRERPALWESLAPERDFSFPSGHAMLSASLAAAVLLLAWPTRARPVAWVFAVLWPLAVASSRLYLGVHFPSDVLAGACAGLAWTVGVYLMARGDRDRYFERVARDVVRDEARDEARDTVDEASTRAQAEVLAQAPGAHGDGLASDIIGGERPPAQALREEIEEAREELEEEQEARGRRGRHNQP